MNKISEEFDEQLSEILYKTNEIHSLFKTIKNSIEYSFERNERLYYILTICEIYENKLNKLICSVDKLESKTF